MRGSTRHGSRHKREEQVDDSVLQLLYKAKDKLCPAAKRRLLEGLGETVGVLMISRHEDGFNHAVIVQMPNIMK